MGTPNPLVAGEPIREGWSQQLVRCIKANGVKSGSRGCVRRLGGGTTFTPPPQTHTRASFASAAFGSLVGGYNQVLFKGGIQLAVACIGATIYVRRGGVSWSNVLMDVDVHPDDFGDGIIWSDENYFYIDAGEAWSGLRYPFVEISQSAREAYLRMSTDSQVPLDDPLAQIVRWKLASVAWTASGVLAVVEMWHVGHIHIPAVLGYP